VAAGRPPAPRRGRRPDPAGPLRRLVGRFWQWQRDDRPLDPDADVTFAIALIGRARAFDWDRVQHNLLWTLGSLLQQNDPRWQALVCGQDRPAGLELDPRIRFLQYGAPGSGQAYDKRPKQRVLAGAMSQERGRDGYLVFVDADDILHPDFVGHCLTTAHRDGYLVSLGYMRDTQSGALGYFGPPTARHPHANPLWTTCGTSSATRFDRRIRLAKLPHRFSGSHGQQVRRFAEFGMHLAEIPFPAVIYSINHGVRGCRGCNWSSPWGEDACLQARLVGSDDHRAPAIANFS
jgi:hypothetical protein